MRADEGQHPTIRLLLELDRNDDPRLYDDLMRFNKGPKRVSRLRLLAHDGLLAQVADARDAGTRHPPQRAGAVAAVARLTSQAFDVPEGD